MEVTGLEPVTPCLLSGPEPKGSGPFSMRICGCFSNIDWFSGPSKNYKNYGWQCERWSSAMIKVAQKLTQSFNLNCQIPFCLDSQRQGQMSVPHN